MQAQQPAILEHTELEELSSQARARKKWIQTWLTFIAFYFPFNWASQTLLFAAPALIRVLLLAHHFEDFDLSLLGARAASVPAGLSGDLPMVRAPISPALATMAPLVIVVAILLVIAGRRSRALSGLAIAVLGQSALIHWLWRFFLRRETSAEVVLGSIVFLGVLCFGLHWMLHGSSQLSYWGRAGTLYAGFVLLPALVWLGIRLVYGMPLWPYARMLMAPGAVLAPLVSLPPVRRAQNRTERVGWKPACWGLAISALLVTGVLLGQRVIERAKLAANQGALASIPQIPSKLPYPKLFFQKGVNFTAEYPDRYGSAGSWRMLEALPRYGINAVALVPYGWTSLNPPSVRINAGPHSWESDAGLEELSRIAHARGIKVLLKPGMWTGKGYPGELEFSSAGDRAKWFGEYQLFVEHYARLATKIHADLFSVGGEFVKLTQFESEWRGLIARVRELYPGPLVYAANFGAEFETIKFWDALDYIGLQEYYPLPDDLATDSVLSKVEEVRRKFDRPVIFTEAGFPSYEASNREPWDDSKLRKLDLDKQAKCYEAVLRAFYRQPWFQGVYWWKVGTNGFGGSQDGSLTPWGKPAMDVVARWYLDGGR